jgi:hypothetical protein
MRTAVQASDQHPGGIYRQLGKLNISLVWVVDVTTAVAAWKCRIVNELRAC